MSAERPFFKPSVTFSGLLDGSRGDIYGDQLRKRRSLTQPHISLNASLLPLVQITSLATTYVNNGCTVVDPVMVDKFGDENGLDPVV